MTRYLISYIDPPTANTGNCEWTLPRPIQSMDDINTLKRALSDRLGLANPIIMGFSAFDEEQR